MIAQQQDITQVKMEPVSHKPELEQRKQALEKDLQDVNLEVRFDNRNATRFGNFHLVETFKKAIGFGDMMESEFRLKKGLNSRYEALQLVDLLVDANILGVSRFSHTEILRGDPGYQKVKGLEHCVPSQALSNMPVEVRSE